MDFKLAPSFALIRERRGEKATKSRSLLQDNTETSLSVSLRAALCGEGIFRLLQPVFIVSLAVPRQS